MAKPAINKNLLFLSTLRIIKGYKTNNRAGNSKWFIRANYNLLRAKSWPINLSMIVKNLELKT